jgi:cation transport ATPase
MGYQALESSRSIDVVVLDKTGTVSHRVTNVRPDIPETAPARSPASADP